MIEAGAIQKLTGLLHPLACFISLAYFLQNLAELNEEIVIKCRISAYF